MWTCPDRDSRPEKSSCIVLSGFDFARVCQFKEQFQGFKQVFPGFLNAVALAGNVQFWAQGNVTVAFTLDNAR